MWPLLGCWVVLIVLQSERTWTYWRMRGEAEVRRILDRTAALIAAQGISRDQHTYCSSLGRLEGQVLSACLSCYRQLDLSRGACRNDRQELERVAEEATYNYLHRSLSVIVFLAQAAVLLGLLGTVLGVLGALAAISRGGEIEIASGNAGLTEALLTTALGLAIAAPAAWVSVRCDRRADRKMIESGPVRMTIVEILICQGNRVT